MSNRARRRNSSSSIRSRAGSIHNPLEIWSTQAGVAAEAVTRAGVSGASIAAIGITNQRETTVVWDRETGQPVYNAIVWQDRRTADFCDQLKAHDSKKKYGRKPACRSTRIFRRPRFAGSRQRRRRARKKARQGRLAFGTVDSWLVWNFTKRSLHITDVTNASRTMLFNIHTLQWDDELAGCARYSAQHVARCAAVVGSVWTDADHAVRIGHSARRIAGDQHAALFGRCARARAW